MIIKYNNHLIKEHYETYGFCNVLSDKNILLSYFYELSDNFFIYFILKNKIFFIHNHNNDLFCNIQYDHNNPICSKKIYMYKYWKYVLKIRKTISTMHVYSTKNKILL